MDKKERGVYRVSRSWKFRNRNREAGGEREREKKKVALHGRKIMRNHVFT